jgi:anti-anti-sigma factor
VAINQPELNKAATNQAAINQEWQLTAVGDNRITLSGSVLFWNVLAIRAEGERLLGSPSSSNELVVDLAQLKKIDSSCLSLLVCWVRYAKAQKKIIKFCNFTNKLHNLVRVSGLEAILPVV